MQFAVWVDVLLAMTSLLIHSHLLQLLLLRAAPHDGEAGVGAHLVENLLKQRGAKWRAGAKRRSKGVRTSALPCYNKDVVH